MALSVFVLADGVVYHTYSCYDRGTDAEHNLGSLGPDAKGSRRGCGSGLAAPPRRVHRRERRRIARRLPAA